MEALGGFVDQTRAVLRMEGAAARDVLQNVITNDVDRLAPGRALYAALLTPQGKYLFDFFLLDGGDGAILIDVARNRAAALAQRLGMYCLRRDASVTGAMDLQVAPVWAGLGRGSPAQPKLPRPPAPLATIVPDPRAMALGWRLYCDDAAEVMRVAGVEIVDRAAYDALRVAVVVPEAGIELIPDDTYILEANFEALHGVDFRKGCFVGQEVTARMHHKTELRKRLVRVRVEGAAPAGTPVTAAGRPVGTLFTQAGGMGLAHLRLDRADGELEAGAARVVYEG